MTTEIDTAINQYPIDFNPAIHATNEDGSPKLNKDGSLAKKRGRKPGSGSGSTSGTMPRKASKKASATTTDYRPGIMGMFQLVAVPLSFTSPLDAWAVGEYAPNVAEALNQVAQERPEVANALEKVLQVGPYGLLIGAVLPLFVQVAANHGVIPEGAAQGLGFVPKSRLMAHLKGETDGEAVAAG